MVGFGLTLNAESYMGRLRKSKVPQIRQTGHAVATFQSEGLPEEGTKRRGAAFLPGGLMTILDEQYAEFEELPKEEKIKCFEKDGRLYDMIISQQLNRQILDDLYRVTNQIRSLSKSKTGSQFFTASSATKGPCSTLPSPPPEHFSLLKTPAISWG
jgi:hypothetical protein